MEIVEYRDQGTGQLSLPRKNFWPITLYVERFWRLGSNRRCSNSTKALSNEFSRNRVEFTASQDVIFPRFSSVHGSHIFDPLPFLLPAGFHSPSFLGSHGAIRQPCALVDVLNLRN
jgi:hypothetical protein